MKRRSFLRRSGVMAGTSAISSLGLAGCASNAADGAPASQPAATPFACYDARPSITPIRADLDRIFRITVCLRPFRAAGPRTDVEPLGDKIVVHNYGHGGSGWSLSWGSAELVVGRAMQAAPSQRDVAVIGCGALGMSAALTALRAGMRVTIYAKERPPYVRSMRATGSWTPDSRIALEANAAPGFAAQWESMARSSFAMYQSYLGAAGNPVEWTDRYLLRDSIDGDVGPWEQDSHGFASYRDRISDLTPSFHDMPPGSTPFPTAVVRRSSSLTFNIASYARTLIEEFQLAGGRIETRQFASPADLAVLSEKIIINCTGYGARALWRDESIIPIRGQIAWLIPQPDVNYAIYYHELGVLARRDGIVVQPNPQGDDTGWNDDNEAPDRSEAENGVRALQALYSRMAATTRPRPSS